MPDNLPVAAGRELAEARKATAEFLEAAKSDATRRAYAADWRDFERWCATHDLIVLPADPENVAVYLSSLATAGKKLSTVRRRAAAIGHFHERAGHHNPATHTGVRATLEGIARRIGSAPIKKAALTVDMLEKVVRKIPEDLAGLRDRAVILLGFAGALRRSELTALDLADVTRHPKGLVVSIRRSKTDQTGRGITKAIPHGRRLKVGSNLDAWLVAGKITGGPIFRRIYGFRVSDERLAAEQVARIVKYRVRAAGFDPRIFAGHSLRSGFITTAADHGASLQGIASHAGHEKLDTTLGYVQVADAFRDHSGKKFL